MRVTADGLELEASIIGGGPLGAVVAPPHPLYGGHMSNPVVRALARGLVRRRLGVLTFNWRGVGTSAGRASGDVESARGDYRAALEHVLTTRRVPTTANAVLVAAGYSFGAAAALAVALVDPRVTEALVVAPPVAMLPPDLESARRTLSIHVIAAEHDEFAPLAELERALAGIASARITVIDGADHFFSTTGVPAIEQAATAE